MKIIRLFIGLATVLPCVSFAAGVSPEFQNASKLLVAARNGDTRTVQSLINNGADINYVDATGLSLVCTAVMNNDKRAIQVLQMYGADASNCDRQIKNYKQKTTKAVRGEEYGFFSGLSSSHVIALSAVGVAGVVGGLALLTDVFDADNNNSSSSSGGSHSPDKPDVPDKPTLTQLLPLNLPYGPGCTNETDCKAAYGTWEQMPGFDTMSQSNYLMISHAYDAFVRGYLGMQTIRIGTDKSPFDLTSLPYVADALPDGGKPVNVAMITGSGVNITGSAVDNLIPWVDASKISIIQSACAGDVSSEACQNALTNATKVSHKYYNYSGTNEGETEKTGFDLSGGNTVFGSATETDTKLAKIIAGGTLTDDFYGFIPNGQLTVYKTGNGLSSESTTIDYKNYEAIYKALTLKDSGNYVVDVIANLSLPAASSELDYATVSDAKILNEASSTEALKKTVYAGLIDNYYNLNTSDDNSVNKPGMDADLAFEYLKNYQQQILVNSAGRYMWGYGTGQSLSPQEATFENFAPVVYPGLENLFMTVVAVSPKEGTAETTIDGYSAAAAGTLELSTWKEGDVTYSSRMCGLTGTGNDGAMNPWCFAAPGTTDMEATAAMAGSVALVKSAFDYMTPEQIFLLLALTADGPYLGKDPKTGYDWKEDNSDLIGYLQTMYTLPSNLPDSDERYLESFKNAFGYGMINLERATRPQTNVYFYSSEIDKVVSSSGKKPFWRSATASQISSSSVLSLTNRGAITTSFYDVIESADGSMSLPRVWNTTLATEDFSKHGLYMGDVLGDFNVDSTNKLSRQVDNMTIDMAMSARAYNDNMNGLDDLKITLSNENYNIGAEYQHHLTNGESRFNGRANGLLALASDSVSADAKYKYGKFAFGGRAFAGTVTNENLLENDPVVSSQFESARLGLTNGASMDLEYNENKFNVAVSVGNMHETDTVLGSLNQGMLALDGADTQYVDAVLNYSPFEKLKLSMRATFANTKTKIGDGLIADISDIKSNAFAFGADFGGFSLTAALPLAVVGGKMGYDYAEFAVVDNNGTFDVAMNNPHTEYIDLSTQKRELRFSGSYRKSIGEFTDAGVGFIYRVNPSNTDAFGNESLFMFKIHHRLGI